MPTFAAVIRKDGTIPFDEGVHPAHRKAILDGAVSRYGALEHHEDCKHGGDHALCTCHPRVDPALLAA